MRPAASPARAPTCPAGAAGPHGDAGRRRPAAGPLAHGAAAPPQPRPNYEVSKVTKHSIVSRAATSRGCRWRCSSTTTSRSKTDAEGKAARRTSTPRPAAEMQKIQQLVAAAVGLDADRGDQLTVENSRSTSRSTNRPPARRSSSASAAARRTGSPAGHRPRASASSRCCFVLRPIVRGVFSSRRRRRRRRRRPRRDAAAAAGSCPRRSRKWSRPSRRSSTPSSPITCRTARRRCCSGAWPGPSRPSRRTRPRLRPRLAGGGRA